MSSNKMKSGCAAACLLSLVLWIATLLGPNLLVQGFALPAGPRNVSNRGAFNTFDSKSTSCARASLMRGPSRLPAARSSLAKKPATWTIKKIGLPSFFVSMFASIQAALQELSLLQRTLFVSVFFMGYVIGRMPPFWKAYREVQDIPRKFFGSKAPTLWGRVLSVSDGDTIRFYHTPFPWQSVPKNKKIKVSQVGLPVRMCTYDTPETPKFGKPGQPFGMEAKEELQKFLGTGPIRVKLLQTDQYGRAVASVSDWRGRPVDEHMLGLGLAEVYTGGGAVYGPKGLEAYQDVEAKAKANKVGIWSQGKKRESAAEYKRRTK